MPRLTHLDREGHPHMVDVQTKPITSRFAVATAEVRMSPATFRAIRSGHTKKGNIFEVARVAGIAAAKQTSALIPLCHPLSITSAHIDFTVMPPRSMMIVVRIEAMDRTGVEMEALTAATVTALTLYDMCKALDRTIEIRRVRLLEKAGGKSGHFKARIRNTSQAYS